MNTSDFDREWRLGELFDARMLERVAPPLAELLGADLAILDRDGAPLWGRPAAEARREALVLEIEPAGYLASSTADPARLHSAGRMFTALLRAEARYRMASALHIEAITQDFETLKLEHSRLLASEARYRKLSEELEARVEAQVADLEARQQQLYQAEKLASIGQLAAGVAHEVNNPLAVIYEKAGLAQDLLSMGKACGDSKERERLSALLESIESTVERARGITHRLLGFARRMEANRQALHIEEVISETLGFLEREAKNRGVKFETELPANLPEIVSDRGQLQQVFLNIVGNALDALAGSEGATQKPQGAERFVKISCQGQGRYMLVSVEDNGKGMSPEVLRHIFEPFYSTKKDKGTGLGMFITYGIVRKLGGEIHVQSEEGRGSIVHITLPLTPPDVAVEV